MSSFVLKDDRRTTDHQRLSNGSVLEFRRRHSTLESNGQMTSSIILYPSIFRTNFRPFSLQVRDYSKTNCKNIFFCCLKQNYFVLLGK
jgi:hypothetical protein